MKNAVLISVFLLIPTCFILGQDATNIELSGFMGLKFGSSYKEAKAFFSGKNGAVFSEKSSDSESQVYLTPTFGGNKASFLILLFYEGKFYKAILQFEDKFATVKTVYNDLMQNLNEKYFKGNAFRIFSYPYEDKESDEELALFSGKATIACFWNFKKDTPQAAIIFLKFVNDKSIKLTYSFSELDSKAADKNKKELKSDY